MPTEEKSVLVLDEYWTIESDARSWNLLYIKEGQINPFTNKPVISRDAHYCATLRQALIKYLEESQSGSESIADAVFRMEQAEKNVNKALTKLFKEMKENK